jgi:hypothetical protein
MEAALLWIFIRHERHGHIQLLVDESTFASVVAVVAGAVALRARVENGAR